MNAKLNDFYISEKTHLQGKWRKSHFRMMIVLSALIAICELVMFFIIPHTNFLDGTMLRYFIRYTLNPTVCYLLITLGVWILIKIKRIPASAKNFIISIGLALVFTVATLMHDFFVMVYAAGIVVITITSVYCDYRITVTTAITVFCASIMTGVFGHWDTSTVKDSLYLSNLILALVIDTASCVMSLVIIHWEENRISFVCQKQLEIMNLQEQVRLDSATGLQNRLGLQSFLARQNAPVSFAMAEIFELEKIGDSWGAPVQEAIVSNLGKLLQMYKSPELTCFRYSSNEFLMAFTNLVPNDVEKLCARIQEDFNLTMVHELSEIGCRIIIGIALPSGEEFPASTIARAQTALKVSRVDFDSKIAVL